MHHHIETLFSVSYCSTKDYEFIGHSCNYLLLQLNEVEGMCRHMLEELLLNVNRKKCINCQTFFIRNAVSGVVLEDAACDCACILGAFGWGVERAMLTTQPNITTSTLPTVSL